MKWLLWIVACLGLLLTGCNTTILVASGKEFSDYQKSIKPYIAYWQKEGVTEEERRRDSLECGGLNDSIQFMGTRVLKAAQRPSETDEETETRLRQDWVACMREKGYQWVKSSSPPSRPRSR